MTDLNAVFGSLFAAVLRPLHERVDMLESRVQDIAAATDSLIDDVEDLQDAPPKYQHEFGDNRTDERAVCGLYPPQDDLFPGQQWSPCDLPYDHDGPHNSSLVI